MLQAVLLVQLLLYITYVFTSTADELIHELGSEQSCQIFSGIHLVCKFVLGRRDRGRVELETQSSASNLDIERRVPKILCLNSPEIKEEDVFHLSKLATSIFIS